MAPELAEPAERPTVAPLFEAVDHVGVAVADLDAALARYAELYGMRAVHQEVNEEQGVREAMLEVGPGGGPYVQLLAPLRPDSPIARFLERSGPGVQQVAYRVRDVEATARTLRERGVRVLYDEARRGTAGSRVNFVHPKDAGGVLVELVQVVEPGGAASLLGASDDVGHPGAP